MKRWTFFGIPAFQMNFKYFGIGLDALSVYGIEHTPGCLSIYLGHLFLYFGHERGPEPWMM